MALSRYRNLNTLEEKKYLETPDFPSQEDLDAIPTVQIVANRFDRLDNLAHVHLGSGEYWWIICLMNNLEWMYDFEEGQILKIPTDLNAVLKLF